MPPIPTVDTACVSAFESCVSISNHEYRKFKQPFPQAACAPGGVPSERPPAGASQQPTPREPAPRRTGAPDESCRDPGRWHEPAWTGAPELCAAPVLLQTGLRLSEMAALRWGNVTLRMRADTVRVRSGKGRNAREVPLWGLYHDVPLGEGRAPPGCGGLRRLCTPGTKQSDRRCGGRL